MSSAAQAAMQFSRSVLAGPMLPNAKRLREGGQRGHDGDWKHAVSRGEVRTVEVQDEQRSGREGVAGGRSRDRDHTGSTRSNYPARTLAQRLPSPRAADIAVPVYFPLACQPRFVPFLFTHICFWTSNKRSFLEVLKMVHLQQQPLSSFKIETPDI